MVTTGDDQLKYALKILATAVLGLVVVITAVFCLGFSICAVTGDGSTQGNRGIYLLQDLIDIVIMVGAVLLLMGLNRQGPTP
jgi:hypothetical protein